MSVFVGVVVVDDPVGLAFGVSDVVVANVSDDAVVISDGHVEGVAVGNKDDAAMGDHVGEELIVLVGARVSPAFMQMIMLSAAVYMDIRLLHSATTTTLSRESPSLDMASTYSMLIQFNVHQKLAQCNKY